MKRSLQQLLLSFLFLSGIVHAQQFNMGFGVSALGSPTSNLQSFGSQSMGGGAYLSFSGDFIFWKQVGVQGEVAWRASESLYQGFQPYRTIFYDFNGIYAPSLGPRASVELLGGIGAASHRFYTPFINCSFTSCTNYVSSNHFMWHTGAGIKIYLTDRVFIRPEAHGYFIHNNVGFSDNIAYRFGASLGYTFGERETQDRRRRY